MKQKLFFLAAAAAVGVLLGGAHTAHGANTYAQYWDNATSGEGTYGVSSTYALPPSVGVNHIQVELNILNDEQRGTSYYCPVAPNTGALIIVWNSNGNFDYVHCITSAEAAGKLGRKALYTFDDANFGYSNGISVGFSSQGSFEADVYGTNVGGIFYPYLVLGDQGGIGSPSLISDLGQYSAGSAALIPENGVADANAVRFESTVSSFFASDTLAMQVEVEPFNIPFTGKPTATSALVPSGTTASTTIGGLAAGTYHWAARAVDAVNGSSSAWTEYRAPGNVDFSVQSVREPVVIVPGIMGSTLDHISDGTEVWPNAAKMALSGSDSYLNDLKLTATGGATTALTVGGIVQSELGVPFYEPLIEALTNDGYEESSTLFIAPYDWRLGVASSVAEIAPVLAQAAAASPDGKINVVAHSMGGLLMKEYLAGRATSSIDKLVFAGVPQLGAPLAYKLLNYGDDLGMDWFGLGLNQGEAKAIAQNMPGVYDLLPTRRYVSINGGYVQDFRRGGDKILDFDGTDDLMLASATDSRNAAMLTGADAFHSGLDGQPVNALDVYNIVGCLTPTVSGFNLYDNGVVTLRSDTGDGTVPEGSAMDLADGFKNYFVLGNETGIDHVGLVTDARPLALITGILDGTTSAALPQGISSSLGDCVTPPAAPAANETTIVFSTHSPVALNVYDPSGRHTGPTDASGDFEAAIPGSRYETIGENTFVFVPGGADYKAVDQGLASGTFEMNVQEYDGSVVTQEATYLSVPLAGTSTAATLSFSGFSGNMGLSLDENGDGVTDAVIQPNAVLAASSTADMTPPDITLPAIPATVTQNATATLAWSATDSGSGIATTTATLNGVPVLDGETVAFTTLGQNIFTLTAFDKAGNPRSGETDFTVVPAVTPPPTPAPTPSPLPTPSPTSSSTISIPVSADTYITPLAPYQNYGKATTLRLGDFDENRILVSVSTGTLAQLRAASSTIVSARLVLTIAENRKGWIGDIWSWLFGWRRGVNGSGVINISRMTTPWTETGATWDCPDGANAGNRKPNCKEGTWNMFGPKQPFAAVASASTTITNAAAGTVSFDITTDVQGMMSGAFPADGWIIARDSRSISGAVDFFSRETARWAPTLVVTYGQGK